MTASLILVALVSLPFIAILMRRPVLRRLALRNAVRRPREAALVVLGSLLGAAIITGSAVVGDTMDASIRQVARTHLGSDRRARHRPEAAEQTQLLQGAAAARVGQHRRRPRVRHDRRRGHEHRAPRPHRAALPAPVGRLRAGARLRRRRRGDGGHGRDAGGRSSRDHRRRRTRARRSAPAGGSPSTRTGTGPSLVVDRVLPRRGVAGFWLGPEQEARNVLVSPKTFDVIRAGGAGEEHRRPGGSRSPTVVVSRAERCSPTT